MESTVENVCKMLVRRQVQSADAVQKIYQRWRKDPQRSDDVRDFVKWLVAKEYLTRQQLSLFNHRKEKEPSAQATTMVRPKASKVVQTLGFKEEEKPRVETTKSALPEIDVELVSLNDPGPAVAIPQRRKTGRDVGIFVGGFFFGAILIGLIWILVHFVV